MIEVTWRTIGPNRRSGFVKGLLAEFLSFYVNYINVPIRAAEAGISITQTKDIGPSIYPNQVSCPVYWDSGERPVAGVFFGDVRPRIVQDDDIIVDAKPEATSSLCQIMIIRALLGRLAPSWPIEM
jgi:hypothetical protein